MSLSNNQRLTRAVHLKARHDYETAEHGDRERRHRELRAAADDVLRADVEARKQREQKRAA